MESHGAAFSWLQVLHPEEGGQLLFGALGVVRDLGLP